MKLLPICTSPRALAGASLGLLEISPQMYRCFPERLPLSSLACLLPMVRSVVDRLGPPASRLEEVLLEECVRRPFRYAEVRASLLAADPAHNPHQLSFCLPLRQTTTLVGLHLPATMGFR